MNITHFIKYLNKQKGYRIDASYYAVIECWKQWWMGFIPEVHELKETGADGAVHKRRLGSLRMPKHACEDWATLLLNDKTTAAIAHDGSAKWMLGNEDQTGGMLQRLQFWPRANGLVEQAFRSGTGAFVLSVEGMQVENGSVVPDTEAKLCMDYIPAEYILPLTVKGGQVQDVAFVSEVYDNGKPCVYLQTHKLEAAPDNRRQYRITNEFFVADEDHPDAPVFSPAHLPAGMAGSFTTGSDRPWFALFSPAGEKNIPGGRGLGMAVFSEAMDAAAQVDLSFDNYRQDIFLGGKKVFYSGRLLKTVIDSTGKEVKIPPDDIRRQQFHLLDDDGDPDAQKAWHEYNPDLRVDSNSKAVQDALNYFSFKCGLGSRRYRFEAGTIKTATEYTGDRQDMVQHANRHQIGIEAALIQIFRAMLWVGKNVMGADVDPEAAVTIHFDDSYITDTEARRRQDKEDALDGFIPKWRYNMTWRGMSEEDAKAAVQEAADEGKGGDALAFDPFGEE